MSHSPEKPLVNSSEEYHRMYVQYIRDKRHERNSKEHGPSSKAKGDTSEQEEVKNLREKVKELEARNAELQCELRTKEEEMQKLINDHDDDFQRLMDERDELEEDLMDSRWTSYHHIDDNELTARFKNLDFIIKQTAKNNYCSPEKLMRDGGSVDSFANRQNNKFARLTLNFQNYLHGPHRVFIIQAYIWRYLVDVVFNSTRAIWAGHMSKEFEAFIKKLIVFHKTYEIESDDYHQWRAQSVALITGIGRDRSGYEDSISLLGNTLWKELHPHQSNDARPESMRKIVAIAAELDMEMSKCRVWYQIFMVEVSETVNEATGGRPDLPRPKQKPTVFSRSDMEEIVPLKGPKYVDLVVSPVVYRRGNSSGEGYEKGDILWRRTVLCAPVSKIQPPPRSASLLARGAKLIGIEY